jgi:hypothetical protein
MFRGMRAAAFCLEFGASVHRRRAGGSLICNDDTEVLWAMAARDALIILPISSLTVL